MIAHTLSAARGRASSNAADQETYIAPRRIGESRRRALWQRRTVSQAVATQWMVRRLTPLECERLQGFPDGYTDVPYCGKPAAGGPRYKALGNSMAVNVMRWIGRRIAMVEALCAATI